ncbi:MAG: ATP phosphoribosyltransferase regulatory subunit [Clostridia bacterium]|nr:ATP phosphoribosyltransferase regulatory subunit [Clostridia bacterium]
MPVNFEKPIGTGDVLPEKLKLIKKVSFDIKEILERWGYEEIDTPLIEYQKTVGLFSKIPDEKLIKFLDPLGNTVILRPDFTTPIARFVASTYKDVEFPIRLMYQGKVYTNLGRRGINEKNQIGLELIGLSSLEGDAEVISLAVQIFLKTTGTRFKVAVGHTNFLRLLLKEVGCEFSVYENLSQALLERDYVAYRNLVNNLELSEFLKDRLLRILKMRGSLESIWEGRSWFDSLKWQSVFKEFSGLWAILGKYQATDYVNFDLSLMGQQNYYTGMIYHVYCEGHPRPVCSGGRYDNLLENFGRPGPATGMAVNLDDLLAVIIKGKGVSNVNDSHS